MQRIVKRFLLHKQRENDEVGDVDFDEIKQDMQMIRYEMINDMKRSTESSMKAISHLFNGLVMIGDEIFKSSLDYDAVKRFGNYKSYDFESNPSDNVSESKLAADDANSINNELVVASNSNNILRNCVDSNKKNINETKQQTMNNKRKSSFYSKFK